MTTDDSNKGGYLSGLVMGAMLGAAAVFFLGTKKGRKLAQVMQEKGTQGLEDLEGIAAEIEQKGSQFAHKAIKATHDLEVKAKTTKKAVAKVAKRELTHLQKLQARGRAAADRYFQSANSK